MCFAFKIISLLFLFLSEINSTGITREDCTCGESNRAVTGRIVGGRTVEQNQYPWQAAMFNTQGFMCGGSIISDRTLITAGHCVFYVPNVYDTYWVLGMHDQIKQDGTRYYVEHYELHPNFVNFSVYDDYDMSMITLKGRIQFHKNVQPICLTTSNDDYTGRFVTVSGWGKLGDYQGAGLGLQLQETNVRVKTNDECAIDVARIVNFNAQSMICAHARGTDACNGDSGGPLFIETNPNRYELIGVVSFGDGCARDFPGIYGKVGTPLTLAWIKNYILDHQGDVCTDPAGKIIDLFAD